MDFDFLLESITPTQTSSLVINATGGLSLPLGDTAARPGSPSAGTMRWNTDTPGMETWNGSAWVASAGSGTVTSVAVSGSTGLSVSGSPITTTGTITLTLGTELQGLSGLSTTGVIARTSSGTYAARTIAGTASNIVVTNGDGVSGAPTINLATAGTAITDSFKKITTDAYGRVTASSSVAASDITTALTYTPINKAGDTAIGGLTLNSAANITLSGGGTITGLPTAPVGSTDAASKAYVDSMAQGLDPKASVRAATTASGTLASSFANGSVIDGVTLVTGNRILIKNQSSNTENGIYTVNASGAPTRATDMDAWTEVPGAYVFIEEGSTLADTGWVCTSNTGGTLGSTAITWVQFFGAGTYTAGTGLTLSGTQFSITSPIATTIGGTGLSSIGSANQVLGVNSGASGLEYKTVTQGTGITVAHAANSITITNAGVTSAVAGTGIGVSGATGAVTITNNGVTGITGTANQITASASTGSVTLSLPASVTIGTSLTVSGLTANSFLYSGTAGLLTTTSAPTNGQLLIGSTGAAPVAAALTAGTGMQVVNAAGSITLNNTGVTSVALSLGGGLFTVSGSPVTTTGTLTGTLASQTANTVFVAPNGSAGAPTFRALAYADLPIKLYVENPSTPTAPTATGTNASAFGSGAAAGAVGAMAFGDGSSGRTWGGKVEANGKFATAGDAQHGFYVARNITSNATATELFLDGVAATQRYVLQDNMTVFFKINVVGRRTDAVGGNAGYTFTGIIKRDAGAATTATIGSVSKTVVAETNSAWDSNVTADVTNGSLKITVAGEAAKTVRWVASIEATEVTN